MEQKEKHSKQEKKEIYLQSLRNRLSNYDKKIANLQLSNAAMRKKLHQLERQIAYNESEIAEAENLKKNLQQKIADLESLL